MVGGRVGAGGGPVVWPLVGRGGEIEYLTAALTGGRGVVLAGKAGVGKSRLVAEATGLARERGFAVLGGAGSEAGSRIPFGALAHLLPATIPAAASREDVVAAAIRALRQPVGSGRVMLAVDDAHLLDGHSAVLVHHLARSDPVVAVLSVRSGQPAPDAVTGLWKDGGCDRLEIHDLSEDQVGELLEAVLGGVVETATRHRIFGQSRGNPLYVRELVLAARDTGQLVQHDGLWRLTGKLAPSMRLAELIGTRLDRLAPAERAALELVAAAEPLEVQTAIDLVGNLVIEGLERAGLLVEQHDGRRTALRLEHPLYAEVLRDQTPPARLRSLAATLSDVIENSWSRRRHDRLRLAMWRLHAGTPTSADVLLPAAELALELCDFPLARRLADAAAHAGAGLPAHLIAARALIGHGHPEQAETLLAGLDTTGWPDPDRVQLAGVRAYNLAWHLGQGTQASKLLQIVEKPLTDSAAQDELTAIHAYHVTMIGLGRPRDAIRVVKPLIERRELPAVALPSSLLALGQGLMWDRRPLEALELLETWRDRASIDTALTWFAPVGSTLYEACALYYAGRFPEAVTLTEAAYHDALGSQAPSMVAFLAAFVGITHQGQGREHTALRWLREGIIGMRDTDAYGALPAALAEIAQAHAMLGQLEQARAALAEAETTKHRAPGLIRSMIPLSRVWVIAAGGDLSLAHDDALESAAAAEEAGLGSVQAILLHDVARLGRPDLVADTLAGVAADSDSPLFDVFARHARALADNDAATLDLVAVEFDAMGTWLLAAEAAAAAAASHRRAGRRSAASAATARATALVERCEGATSPPLAALLTPLPLTARQREIATLAATGLTNQQIAQHLVVSPRTVGNHLHDIYMRLGITGRDQLAAIMLPRAPLPGPDPMPESADGVAHDS